MKSNWISYDEEKPPIGIEVLSRSEDWINEDFNKFGIRIGFQNEDKNRDFITAKWDNSSDLYETIESFPTHWKFIN